MIVKTIQKTSGNDKEQFEIVIILDNDHSEFWIFAQYTDPDGSRHATIGRAHAYNDNPLRFPSDEMAYHAGKAMFAAWDNKPEPRPAEYPHDKDHEFYNDWTMWSSRQREFLQSPTFSWACDWLKVWENDQHEKFLDLFRGDFHFPFVSPEKKAELLAGSN